MPDPINPYIAGSPVTGTEMFFGREDVFAFVRQALTGRHRDNVLVLYGQRRTGKTSVMYQMHRHLDPRYLCVFVDLHGLALESLGGFLWELASHIARVLRREHQIELPRLERAAFEAEPRAAFEAEFLNYLWSALGDRHLLLMLDEAVRLQEQVRAGKLEKVVFDYLRHLMQHFDRLNFLFALGSGLEEMEKEYAFLFSVGLYKKISFLDRDSALALITQPVKDSYQVEPAAVERILQITTGHPYYTQLICHSLFNRWLQQRAPAITAAHVDAVLDEVVERGLAVLKHVWEESAAGEKAVLAGLASAMGEHNRPVTVADMDGAWAALGVTVPKGETAKAVQGLIVRDVLAGSVGEDSTVAETRLVPAEHLHYLFTVDLQRLWVQKYERLEWVKEEITETVRGWEPSILHEPIKATVAERMPLATVYRARKLWIAALVAAVMVGIISALVLPNISSPVTRAPGTGATATVRPSSTVMPQPSGGVPVIPAGEASLINDLVVVSNTVWAATDGGLVRWTADGRGRVFTKADGLGFGDNWRQAVAVAPDGTLWLGGGGVAHIRPAADQLLDLGFYNKDDGLCCGTIRALMVDRDNSVWAGGVQASPSRPSLSRFDGQSWRSDDPPIDHPALKDVQVDIWSLLRSNDGALWLGLVRDGVLRWDRDRRSWTPFGVAHGIGGSGAGDYRIRGLLQDRRGTIWAAASDRGLLRFDAAQGRWHRITVLGDAPIRAIAQFADGALWAAGDRLVVRSSDEGQRWDQVGTADGLGADIGSLVQDADGRIWAGAYEGGLSVFDGQQWRALQR